MRRFDIMIIGGGIAGMTAAIYAARANMSVVILEKEICGGLVNGTYVLENVPSYPAINGMELMEKVKDHATALGVTIEEIAEVDQMDISGLPKILKTEDDAYTAKTVIICSGRVPIALPVASDWENIHYCSVCDGTAYSGKDLVVVGGGNSGFDESLYLLGLGVKSIILVESMESCLADAVTQEKLRATGRVNILTSTVVVGADNGVVTLINCNGEKESTLKADGMFVFIGQKPNTAILDGIVELDHQGYIVADGNMQTNIPGVFAAGDVIVKKHRQITTAMGDGTIAALNAVKYIRDQVDNDTKISK
jgi:thioredoxin reductase (NADPH)